MKDGENNKDFKFFFPANILYVTQSYFSSNLFLSFLRKNFKEKISSAGERTKKKAKANDCTVLNNQWKRKANLTTKSSHSATS